MTDDEVEKDIAAVQLAADLIEVAESVATDSAAKLAAMTELIARARADRVNETLGEPNWSAWLQKILLGIVPTDLQIPIRTAVCEVLIRAGLSTRTIAPIVGVSHSTVARTAVDAIEENVVIVGADGKQYPPPAREVVAYSSFDEGPRRNRRPFAESFYRSVTDTSRTVRAFERFTRDDRFAAQREALQSAYRAEVKEMHDLLTLAMERLAGAVTQEPITHTGGTT